jgi:hypothetical protein
MHIPFDPSSVDWTLFIDNSSDTSHIDIQFGNGISQYGMGSYPVFCGMPYQRGAGGIGSLFKSLMRYIMPIGRAIGREGLDTGQRILKNIVEGGDAKKAVISESSTGLQNLLSKASANLNKTRSSQSGEGIGRYVGRRRMKKNIKASPQGRNIRSLVAPPSALQTILKTPSSTTTSRKHKRVDSLGPY